MSRGPGSGTGFASTPAEGVKRRAVTVYMPESLRAKLQTLAQRQRRSVSAQVIVMLESMTADED